jgi:PPR repeat
MAKHFTKSIICLSSISVVIATPQSQIILPVFCSRLKSQLCFEHSAPQFCAKLHMQISLCRPSCYLIHELGHGSNEALKMLNEILDGRSDVELDVRTFSFVIHGLCKAGHLSQSLEGRVRR